MAKEKLKLISYPEEGTDEAYNLEEDPGEQTPLPERSVAYLFRQTMRAWSASLKPLPRPEKVATAEEKAAANSSEDGGAEDYSEPKDEAPGPVSDKALPENAPAPKAVPKPKPAVKPSGNERGGSNKERGGASKKERAAGKNKGGGGMKDVPDDVKESLKSLGYLE